MDQSYIILIGIFVAVNIIATNAGKFSVYDPVPGLDPSPYYSLKIRKEGSDHWTKTFVLLTECTEDKVYKSLESFIEKKYGSIFV